MRRGSCRGPAGVPGVLRRVKTEPAGTIAGCFAGRLRGALGKTRVENATEPGSAWNQAETNRGPTGCSGNGKAGKRSATRIPQSACGVPAGSFGEPDGPKQNATRMLQSACGVPAGSLGEPAGPKAEWNEKVAEHPFRSEHGVKTE